MNRRTFLASATAVTATLVAGCPSGSDGEASPTDRRTDTEVVEPTRTAHTVSVYLGERDETHDVTATVTAEEGTVLFRREYSLSDDNEADEDATFRASTQPETVVVTIDGVRFERDWPGFEHPELPCEGENRAGIELYVESGGGDAPTLRMEPNCQSVPAA